MAHGFLKIANAKMAEAIKKVTEAKGYDVVCTFHGACSSDKIRQNTPCRCLEELVHNMLVL